MLKITPKKGTEKKILIQNLDGAEKIFVLSVNTHDVN